MWNDRNQGFIQFGEILVQRRNCFFRPIFRHSICSHDETGELIHFLSHRRYLGFFRFACFRPKILPTTRTPQVSLFPHSLRIRLYFVNFRKTPDYWIAFDILGWAVAETRRAAGPSRVLRLKGSSERGRAAIEESERFGEGKRGEAAVWRAFESEKGWV